MSKYAQYDQDTHQLLNQKSCLIDTGANINAAVTYAGMLVYCTSTGNGFYKDAHYKRNADNSAWDPFGYPIGSIVAFGGNYNAIPTSWLICDGSAVSRTTYDGLFNYLGTKFGVGDGSTTFNLPDLRAKFPRGAPNATNPGSTGGEDTHTLTTPELPAHQHGVASATKLADGAAGGVAPPGAVTGNSSSIGGSGAHENRPAYQQVIWMIKA